MKLAVVAGILLIATITQGQSSCSESCLSNFCNTTFPEKENQCSLNDLSQASVCNSSECSNTILKCQGSLPTFFSLKRPDICIGGFNISLPSSEGDVADSFGAGFYIIVVRRFCKTNHSCIRNIQLHGYGIDLSADDLLEFHVYKRYERDFQRVVLYIEQFSFNVSLKLKNDIWEATPINPWNAPLCVQGGEYLGFTVRGNLRINGTSEDINPAYGVLSFERAPFNECSGVNTLETENRFISPRFPVMDIQYFDGTEMPTDSTTDMTTEMATSSNGSTFTTGSTFMTPITTTVDPPSNIYLFIITGVGIASVVAVAILITGIIFLCFCVRRRNYDVCSKNIHELKNGDIVSMNSLVDTYQDNHNFKCPVDNKNIETVINPAAEFEADQVDHIYNEPFEMDNVKAWPTSNVTRVPPNRELPPLMSLGTGTVTNVHYISNSGGLDNDPSNPEYQDPDELASMPMMKIHRSTVKNMLYSTTEEFGTKEGLDSDNQQYDSDGQLSAIYNEPFELGVQPVRPGIIPSVRGNLLYASSNEDDFRDKSENSSESSSDYIGADCSNPVRCDSLQTERRSFSATNPMALLKRGLTQLSDTDPESCGEVGGEKDHIYYILNENGNHIEKGNTEDGEDDITKSNAHHVVNEPGAYVPNSEERRDMYVDDTLSPQLFEAWRKTSYKKGKFFVRFDKFWVPSPNKATLFDQLSQKKFREIFTDQFQIISHIGHGQFGSVQKAKLKYTGGSLDVAVKVMKPSIQENAQVKFLQEAAIMGQFFHSNIIKLYGIVTLNNPLMIVMEYMPLGDLQSYLCKHYRLRGAAPPQPVTLLKFCRQIAYGMAYLARKHFVHRDLAARNIFISSTLVCKVGDFGMSRNLMDEEYYKSQGGVVPIKWTAPEGLRYKKYTTASDVYSYGMTMFEIWSIGEKPLRDLPIQRVAETVAKGYCQAPPPGTPRRIYEVMVQCWNPDESKRSSIDVLLEILQNSDERLLDWLDSDIKKMNSPKAQIIGSALEEGHSLYKDLQDSYHGITPDMTM